jgi:Cytochrome c554 and c-prime
MHFAAALAFAALLAAALPAAASDECLACHGQQGLTKSFAGGETLSLHVDGAAFAASVHAPVGCAACHAAIDPKTHPAKTRQFENRRAYAIAAVEACRACHEPIYDAWLGSLHGKAREGAGPVCADCHSPHQVTRASVGTRLKDTCLTCHAGAPEAHAAWLPNSRRHLAVVACAACHAPEAKRKVDLRFYDAAGKNEIVGGYGELQPGKPLDEKNLWALMHGAGGKVRLVGRIEVTSADQAHAMADRGQALKECTTCHRKGAEAFQNVTVSVVGPDGRRVYYDAQKEVLSAPTSVDSVRGFYAVGGTRVGALDLALLAVLAGGMAAPLVHFLLRRLLRRKGSNGQDLH